MGHTADAHQTAYAFAHMAVQTSEPTQIPSHPNDKVLEGLRKTLGGHVWLANVAAPSLEIYAGRRVGVPLCLLGSVVGGLRLFALWAPASMTLSCLSKTGKACKLMMCPIKVIHPTLQLSRSGC